MITKGYAVSVRFVGNKFDTRSVPIYELGEVLVALQRMINRAYLFSLSDIGDEKGALLGQTSIHGKSMRQKLSLQLAGREKGSDIYHLTWFADNVGADAVRAILSQVASAAKAYTQRKVYSGTLENPNRVNSNASAMYGEVQTLANRIKSVGDIEQIEISMQGQKVPIVIDKETKTYIKQLQKLEYLGEKDVIGGRIVTAHVDTKDAVDVYLTDRNRRVRVYVSRKVFNKIIKALAKDQNPYFEFRGKPRLKVGYLVSQFREFVASAVKVTPSAPLPGKPIVVAPRPKRGNAGMLHGKPVIDAPPPKKKRNN
jgi:hypothetical protein